MKRLDYIITEQELSENFGLNVRRYLRNNDSGKQLILLAYEMLNTRIFDWNDNIERDEQSIFDLLNSDYKIYSYKYAQYLIIWGLITLGAETSPITEDVDGVIRFRLKISMKNGVQR